MNFRTRRVPATTSSVLAIMTGLAACAVSERPGPPPDPAPFVPDEAGAPPPSTTCENIRCSRDLKQVVSGCGDQVVAECPPGTACGDGRCMAPCAAVELSQGSVGCSFWTLPPDSATEGKQGSCFAALVANTWDQPVNLSAELGADPLDITKSVYIPKQNGTSVTSVTYTPLTGALPPGEVAIVFLSQMEGAKNPCPAEVTPAIARDPISHGTSLTKAFHLTADRPVSAYSIFPYGGASSQIPSATLLLPVSSWATSSLLVNPASGYVTSSIGGTTRSRTFLQIVASEDDTQVRIHPKADISDGVGVTGTASGVSQSWTLARGEVLQITQLDELSGSPIESNKAFGLFSGAECHQLPGPTFGFCDSMHQQIPMLSSWGHDYVLVPYKPRVAGFEKAVPWRFVGAVDGTVLTYDPAPPVGAPLTLQAGEVASLSTDRIVTVKSQDADHPFYAAVYMTSAMFNAGSTGNPATRTTGDPDFVNIVPSDQFLDSYVFFTDHTYANTTLTIVRRKTDKGFLPVELDCAGEITGFVPVGTTGDYEYAWVELTSRFQPQTFAKGTCGYGRHAASSEGPFSVTVWGTDLDASYGYPGGMGLRPITTVKPTVPK